MRPTMQIDMTRHEGAQRAEPVHIPGRHESRTWTGVCRRDEGRSREGEAEASDPPTAHASLARIPAE